MLKKIVDAFAEFFGSLLGIPSVINRPLHKEHTYGGALSDAFKDDDAGRYIEEKRSPWKSEETK